jgi:hypothetical protein
MCLCHTAAQHIGADSPFFALLGSAPQELNTIWPEAKLECVEIARTKSKRIFYSALALAVETLSIH